MRKLREVLRLRYELNLGYQQIGRSCAIGVSTVHKYLKRAEAAGLRWPLPGDWDEARVNAVVFPRREPTIAEHNPARASVDFAAVHDQLRSSRYVTLQMLWEEYRQANPEGYRYSCFCELYQRWRSKLDVVLRQEHKAGEKMFVDWAGAAIAVHDRHTGGGWQAPLFVAALGASSYTWAEATRDQQMEAWLRCHVHAFEYFQGIPALVVAFDANFYSVPYNLVHEVVEIRSTPTTVEILHKGTRVASHLRSRERGQAVTQDQHRPKSHREHLEWTPSRMVHWAASIGPHTARLFERIMADKPHPGMAIAVVWASSGWQAGTRHNAWSRLASERCSAAPAATRSSRKSSGRVLRRRLPVNYANFSDRTLVTVRKRGGSVATSFALSQRARTKQGKAAS